MIRSSIGISKLPVSPEIDPGFGPDTEQRRVDFATKLEEEAFSISLGDSKKLAKANLVKALRLWGRDDLVKQVEKLNLQEIMIIWLVFEISYIFYIWSNATSKVLKSISTYKIENFRKFIELIFKPHFENIPNKFLKTRLNLKDIRTIREKFGGDLIFGLKLRNDEELIKIYEMTYNKLSKSLRDKFRLILIGIDIKLDDIMRLLKQEKKDVLTMMIRFIVSKLEDKIIETEVINSMCEIIKAFDEKSSELFSKFITSTNKPSKEVEDKVKSYYGIE